VVSTVGAKRATGRYTLRVSDGALPIEAKGNCRFSRGGAVAGGGGGGGGAGGPPVQRRGTGDQATAVRPSVPGQLTRGAERHPVRQTGHFVLSITQGHKPEVNDACTQPQSGRGLQVSEGPLVRARDAQPAGAAHSIDVGQNMQGQLTRNDVLLKSDSTYAQAWTIHGRQGQSITIDLESDAFDA